jgi:hypothetical protein
MARRTSSVDAVVVRETAALKRLKRETEADAKRLITKLIEIGQRLKRVRECTKHGAHGEWMRYLKKNFDWSPDTASNYMALFELSKTPKFRRLRNFPIDLLYRLSRMGEEAQERVIKQVESGKKPREAMRDVHPSIIFKHLPTRTWSPPPPPPLPPARRAVFTPPPQPAAKAAPSPQAEASRLPTNAPAPPPASRVAVHPSSIAMRAAALVERIKEIITCYADDDAAAAAAIISWEDIEIIERIVQAVKKAKAEAEPIELDAS